MVRRKIQNNRNVAGTHCPARLRALKPVEDLLVFLLECFSVQPCTFLSKQKGGTQGFLRLMELKENGTLAALFA